MFKIQASMDPKHATASRSSASAQALGCRPPSVQSRDEDRQRAHVHGERTRAKRDAVAGDITGIHNHGQLQIGDTLTQGEDLAYTGIPYFAPELFRVARPRDPFRAKQLGKGLAELGEEGAIQVFESAHTNTLLLGAVGPLQFEIVAHRLATEYNVDALYDPANVVTARWLSFPDAATRRDFEREQAAALATDVDGNPVPRDQQVQPAGDAPSAGEDRYATREHRRRIEQG